MFATRPAFGGMAEIMISRGGGYQIVGTMVNYELAAVMVKALNDGLSSRKLPGKSRESFIQLRRKLALAIL